MEELKHRKLLTRDEAAFYIGICKATLSKIIHTPDFPALVRVGNGRGRVFINREKLDAWIDESTGQPAQQSFDIRREGRANPASLSCRM